MYKHYNIKTTRDFKGGSTMDGRELRDYLQDYLSKFDMTTSDVLKQSNNSTQFWYYKRYRETPLNLTLTHLLELSRILNISLDELAEGLLENTDYEMPKIDRLKQASKQLKLIANILESA